MSEFTFNTVTMKPFIAPRADPQSSVRIRASAGSTPRCFMSSEPTEHDRKAMEPTEMSNRPEITTRASPDAITARGDIVCTMLSTFCTSKKCAVPSEKLMKASTRTTQNPLRKAKSIARFVLMPLRSRAGRDRIHEFVGAGVSRQFLHNPTAAHHEIAVADAHQFLQFR